LFVFYSIFSINNFSAQKKNFENFENFEKQKMEEIKKSTKKSKNEVIDTDYLTHILIHCNKNEKWVDHDKFEEIDEWTKRDFLKYFDHLKKSLMNHLEVKGGMIAIDEMEIVYCSTEELVFTVDINYLCYRKGVDKHFRKECSLRKADGKFFPIRRLSFVYFVIKIGHGFKQHIDQEGLDYNLNPKK